MRKKTEHKTTRCWILYYLFLAVFLLQGCTWNKYIVNNDNRNEESEKKEEKEGKDKIKDKKKRIKGIINRDVDSTKTNTYVLEYMFSSKDKASTANRGIYARNNLKARVDHPMVFRINNINRFAYEVTITSTDSVLAQTYLLDATVAPTSDDSEKKKDVVTDVDVAKVLVKSIYELKTIGKEEIKVSDCDSKKNDETEEKVKQAFITEINHLPTLQKLYFNLNEVSSTLYMKDVELRAKRINKEQDTFFVIRQKDSLQRIITKIEKTIDSVHVTNDALRKFNEDNQNFIFAFGKLRGIYNNAIKITAYYNTTKNILENPELTKSLYQKEYKSKLDSILIKVTVLEKEIANFNSQYTELGILYSYFKYNPGLEQFLNYGGRVKLYSHSDDLKKIADKMNDAFQSANLEKLTHYLQRNIPLLEEQSTYEIVSAPIQPKKDVVIFNVNIQRKSTKNELYSNLKFNHTEFVRGGTRFDAGIGLVGGLYPNAASYEFGQEGDSVTIHRKSKISYIPALIGMVTVSRRSAGYITWGGSAGLGIDVHESEIKLGSFYAGFSAIIGKYDRITVTGGISMKNVVVLRKVYSIGNTYPVKDNVDNFLTREYRAGFFMALTYNLTRGVKDNIKLSHLKSVVF